MVSDKHGLKDQVAGKLKEVKGKLTNDKGEQVAGKVQKLLARRRINCRTLKKR